MVALHRIQRMITMHAFILDDQLLKCEATRRWNNCSSSSDKIGAQTQVISYHRRHVGVHVDWDGLNWVNIMVHIYSSITKKKRRKNACVLVVCRMMVVFITICFMYALGIGVSGNFIRTDMYIGA
ncbi:unnamed protein product [Cuscuta epithymum]|uniref:Transmembrane protein n=1 Tax=Cuscuta epithymum TaxID=186058 RepID=A0AAV0DTV6_9ASTE|nr:unnamed protein product [Cuscuta epithymum]